MKSISEVSTSLRSALKSSDMKQQQLREKAGVSRQTLANVLKGTEDYKLSTLLALADRLGLELVMVHKGAARGLDAPKKTVVVESVVDRVKRNLVEVERKTNGVRRSPSKVT